MNKNFTRAITLSLAAATLLVSVATSAPSPTQNAAQQAPKTEAVFRRPVPNMEAGRKITKPVLEGVDVVAVFRRLVPNLGLGTKIEQADSTEARRIYSPRYLTGA